MDPSQHKGTTPEGERPEVAFDTINLAGVPQSLISPRDLRQFVETVFNRLCTSEGFVDPKSAQVFLDVVGQLSEDECSIIREDTLPGSRELLAFLKIQSLKARSIDIVSDSSFLAELQVALPLVCGMALRSQSLGDLHRVAQLLTRYKLNIKDNHDDFQGSILHAGYKLISLDDEEKRNCGLKLVQLYSSGASSELYRIAEKMLENATIKEAFANCFASAAQSFNSKDENFEILFQTCWELLDFLQDDKAYHLTLCSDLLDCIIRVGSLPLDTHFQKIYSFYNEIPRGLCKYPDNQPPNNNKPETAEAQIEFALSQDDTRQILLSSPAIALMLEGRISLRDLHDLLKGNDGTGESSLVLSEPVTLIARLLDCAVAWTEGDEDRLDSARRLLSQITTSSRRDYPVWPLAQLQEAKFRASYILNGRYLDALPGRYLSTEDTASGSALETALQHLFSTTIDAQYRFNQIFRCIFCLPSNLSYLQKNPAFVKESVDAAYNALIWDGAALDLSEQASKSRAHHFLRRSLNGLLHGECAPLLAAARIYESDEFANVLADFASSNFRWRGEIGDIIRYATSPEDLRRSLEFVYHGTPYSAFSHRAHVYYSDVVSMGAIAKRFLKPKNDGDTLFDNLQSIADGISQMPFEQLVPPPMSLQKYSNLSGGDLWRDEGASPFVELSIGGQYYQLFGQKSERKTLFAAFRQAHLHDKANDPPRIGEIAKLEDKILTIIDQLCVDEISINDALDSDIVAMAAHAEWGTYAGAENVERIIADWPQTSLRRNLRRELLLAADQKQTRVAAEKRFHKIEEAYNAFAQRANKNDNRLTLCKREKQYYLRQPLGSLGYFDYMLNATPSIMTTGEEDPIVLRAILHDLLKFQSSDPHRDASAMNVTIRLFESSRQLRNFDSLKKENQVQVLVNLGVEIQSGMHDEVLFSGANARDISQLRSRLCSALHLDLLQAALEKFAASQPSTPSDIVQENGEKVEISLHASTGLLRELSGFVSDVCWARDPLVFEEKENVFYLAFRLESNLPAGQLIGGTLVILAHEAESGREDPVFIIRGFNPHPELAKNLYPGELFDKTIQYLRTVGREIGVRHILVPVDRGPMLALTNSFETYYHVRTHHYGGRPLRCASRQLIEFNHQVIHNRLSIIETSPTRLGEHS